ncbi:MAG: COR domain-containing protein [Phormidesmis sp.]
MTQDELLRLIDQASDEGWKTLDLSGQDLTELPPEIGKLTQLETLILGKRKKRWSEFVGNRLKTLPAEIGQLTNLKTLLIEGNQLERLPAEIGLLQKLRILMAGKNRLAELPKTFEQLSELRVLIFDSNKFTSIPTEVAQLYHLMTLWFYDSSLENVLSEIGQLTNLRSLVLISKQLSSLPPEILQLTSLRLLALSSNQLSSLPPESGRLTSLRLLALRFDQLSSLPAEIVQLTSLTSLDLSSNQLSSLPAEIGQLKSLTSLNLSSNQLSSLPAEIGQLKSLTSLVLTSNQLSSLPPEIGQLTNLTSLFLSANQLSSLPPEIGQLKKLEKLDLRGNPIPIPPEILEPKEFWQDVGNVTEILDFYFQTLDPEESEPLYEAKLLIIGEGGAGKTTLAKKIDNADYELQPEEKSTEGIDVVRWDFDHPNGQPFRANIWDFGGQEIYHATHQFFLTKRSLYTIVVDARQDSTDLYYWLNVVELLSDNSPVFIIKNEKQDRTCEVNERQLRSEFPNLKETLRTNLKENRGLDEIKAKLQQYITHLPHVGTPLPKIWVRVRACLENYSQHCNYIPIETYYELCEQNQFKNREQMLSLSRYLHDLGVCLHFHEDDLLKKTLILSPEWGTTAVYKALDTDEVKENMGRFSRAQLNDSWSDGEYADMQGELLQLMVNFKLCYPIPGSDNEYIAPQLLDIEQPDYDWDDSNNLLLRYHYDFMPKGILTRFIVEMHRFIEGQKLVWKTGVVLNNGSARAEVIEYYHKGEIHIRVSGNRCRDFLTIVSFKLDEINASYERLKDKCKKLIPCNCSTCDGSQTPHFYPRETLDQFIADGQLQIQCQKSYAMVNVRSLIDDVSFHSLEDLRPSDNFVKAIEGKIKLKHRADSWPTQTEKTMKIPKVFISYAHEDEKFKEEIDEMMEGMKRRGVIETWQDRLIEPGDDWSEAIQTAMNDSDIGLLLISKYFIKSRFINDEEVPKLLERRKSEGMRVIPIIIRPCLWTSEPLLKKLQALPKDGKPVIKFNEENGDRDQAWTDIAKAIEKIAKELRTG